MTLLTATYLNVRRNLEIKSHLPTIPTQTPQNKFAKPTVRPAPNIMCPETRIHRAKFEHKKFQIYSFVVDPLLNWMLLKVVLEFLINFQITARLWDAFLNKFPGRLINRILHMNTNSSNSMENLSATFEKYSIQYTIGRRKVN